MSDYNKAVVRAYNAAELKASDVRSGCGAAPIDHAAQAALENSDLSGPAFGDAYDEVFETIHKLSQATNDTDAMAESIRRLRFELQ
jgi:hypothetical protein